MTEVVGTTGYPLFYFNVYKDFKEANIKAARALIRGYYNAPDFKGAKGLLEVVKGIVTNFPTARKVDSVNDQHNLLKVSVDCEAVIAFNEFLIRAKERYPEVFASEGEAATDADKLMKALNDSCTTIENAMSTLFVYDASPDSKDDRLANLKLIGTTFSSVILPVLKTDGVSPADKVVGNLVLAANADGGGVIGNHIGFATLYNVYSKYIRE